MNRASGGDADGLSSLSNIIFTMRAVVHSMYEFLQEQLRFTLATSHHNYQSKHHKEHKRKDHGHEFGSEAGEKGVKKNMAKKKIR